MSLAPKVLAVMRKLGFETPEDLEKTRWPTVSFESKRIDGEHWFEPRQLRFHRPVPFPRDANYVHFASTDDENLLFLKRELEDAKTLDPRVFVFDPEEPKEMLTLPFSTLLGNLRRKKAVAKAQTKLYALLDDPLRKVSYVEATIAEGADVNQEDRRDVMVSPLGIALRSLHKRDGAAIVALLLQKGADSRHPTVVAEILSRASSSPDYDALIASFIANGGELPREAMFSKLPTLANPATLELFLERGFDPNASIEFGGAMPLMRMSFLCDASMRGTLESVELLVRSGSNVLWVEPRYGVAVLHFAVLSNDAARVVPFLLSKGARDVRSNAVPKHFLQYERKDVEIAAPGCTAKDLAGRLGRADIAALFS